MNNGLLLARLFSRTTVGFLFIVVLALLAASFSTYVHDRRLQSVSLGAMRMASWNLAQLGNEANSFDRELTLVARGVGDTDQLTLRYDILWSRYDYLLNSKESEPTRRHDDNEERLRNLFDGLQALEQPIEANLALPVTDWSNLVAQWQVQKTDIQQLVIDNFVGNEASRLFSDVEASRDRLANLRFLTLLALAGVFIYLALAITFARRQSRTDPVTGLPNNHYLNTIKTLSADCTIATCEIRGFQLVLSDHGNSGANELLRQFVRKLRSSLSSGDELIQVSQGEFVILLSPRPGQSPEDIAERLVSATTFDWQIENSVLHVSAVFGVDPSCERHCPDWNTRYQQSHRALEQAHIDGCSYYVNREDLRRRLGEERKIHAGLLKFFNNEPGSLQLNLVYQPIVSARNRNLVTGAEVLLRCKDRDIGFVPPNRVVDLCERFGLGLALGQWLFRQIAAETRPLYQEMGFTGNLSINLNPAMLADTLYDDVQMLLVEAGIPARFLCLEITEDNAALEFVQINQLIKRLHGLGVTFALDDFGTGHSSLEYVRELKVDRLKIDRCFVDGIENSEDDARFLGSIIAMAELAYMKSVVEGVENEAQWQMVAELGDVFIQGYHAHKPMPLNDYIELLLAPMTQQPSTIQ